MKDLEGPTPFAALQKTAGKESTIVVPDLDRSDEPGIRVPRTQSQLAVRVVLAVGPLSHRNARCVVSLTPEGPNSRGRLSRQEVGIRWPTRQGRAFFAGEFVGQCRRSHPMGDRKQGDEKARAAS
jgi:hypothetical protein